MFGLLRSGRAQIGLKRLYSSVQPRPKPTWRDLLLPFVFKSLFLTLVFGSVVVDATRARKELEALKAAYEAKFKILEEVTRKVKAREPVDVAQELRIANALTRHKYNSVTDVELDEQFEELLRMAEDQPEEVEVAPVLPAPSTASTEVLKSDKFL